MVALSGHGTAVLSPRRAVRLSVAVVLVALEIYLLAPHVAAGGAALANLRWAWVAGAVACEAAAVAMFGRVRRSLLRSGGVRVPLGRMGALAVASSAISATVPAGTAVSAGYLYRQLRRGGASAPLVAWTLTAAAVVSALAFSVLTLAGAVLGGHDSVAALAGAGGLSLLAVVAFIAVLGTLTRHPRPIVRALHAVCRRLPWSRRRPRACDAGAVERIVEDLSAIRPRWRDWGAAFWFALLNWVADLACFVLCCYAVGVDHLGLGVAVLAYVTGLATSSLSVLPGGLGTVEAGLLVGLSHAGVGASLAVAGILAYRLVAYALVGAVGWTVWGLLRRRAAAPV